MFLDCGWDCGYLNWKTFRGNPPKHCVDEWDDPVLHPYEVIYRHRLHASLTLHSPSFNGDRGKGPSFHLLHTAAAPGLQAEVVTFYLGPRRLTQKRCHMERHALRCACYVCVPVKGRGREQGLRVRCVPRLCMHMSVCQFACVD